MKRLVLLAILALAGVPAYAATPTARQAPVGGSSGAVNTSNWSPGGATTAGDILVLVLAMQYSDSTIKATATDNGGNTYNCTAIPESTVTVTAMTSVGNVQICYKFNAASMTTGTYNLNHTEIDGEFAFYDYTGVATSADPLDTGVALTKNNATCTGTSCPGIAITNAAPNEITFEASYMQNSISAVSGTGWVLDFTTNGNGWAHRPTSSSAASTPTFTGGSGNVYCVTSAGFWDVAPVTAKPSGHAITF